MNSPNYWAKALFPNDSPNEEALPLCSRNSPRDIHEANCLSPFLFYNGLVPFGYQGFPGFIKPVGGFSLFSVP